MYEKRFKEIADRKLEIRAMLEGGENVDLNKIQEELRSLEAEEKQLRNRLQIIESLKNTAPGHVPASEPEVRTVAVAGQPEKRKIEDLSNDELLASPEYRSAFLKRLQGKELTDIEKRALTTASNSAGAAVPTTTMNMIVDKLRQTSVLFPRVNVSYVPGNLSIVVANAKNAASWKSEGVDGTPADDTVIKVNLAGYELIKLVEISAAASSMTIDAFEQYITAEIGRQMSIAIENAILNGTGTDQPTGILPGITWVDGTNATSWAAAATVDYDNIMDGLALLPTMYHNNAVFVMNRKMLFDGIRKIKDTTKQPIFTYNPQDRAAMTILGYPILLDDYMPDDTILLGDLSYYYMNFSKPIELSSSVEAGFKSGKITYRGLAVADGKPGLAEAFVKIYKAAV